MNSPNEVVIGEVLLHNTEQLVSPANYDGDATHPVAI